MESAHKSEEAVETGAYLVREGYRSHKLKPYRKAAQAEQKLEKANVNVLYQKSLRENPRFASAQAELARVFAAQYHLTLTEEVEIRTYTDEAGDTQEYEYRILNVKLASKPISALASELLTPEQLEMYQVYRQTLGNKPLMFGGGSTDTSDSEESGRCGVC